MNRIFQVIWNQSKGVWQAASELGRSSHGSSTSVRGVAGSLKAIAAGTVFLIALPSYASDLPSGGTVVGGQGSISRSDTTLTVNQNSQNVAINWRDFSIAEGHTVNFVQPNAEAAALNRVTGNNVSDIRGALNANGRVFLVNPNGVMFSATAQVDVGSLVASTLDISTEDFMAGNYQFEGASANAIINQGNITAAEGGAVAMIAAKIINTGDIHTPSGSTLMGAGNKVILDLGGPVKIEVEEALLDTYIEQGGAIRADGGLVYLTAKSAGDLASSVINHTGITEARTLAAGKDGRIMLMGDMDSGQVQVAGKLDASAPTAGDGGFIETSAAKVVINDVHVTTRAHNGKTGEWLIDPNDYTIAASGGDMTGAQLSNHLSSTNVTIESVDGGNTNGNGDIFVNDDIKVTSGNSDTTLTLKAVRSIIVDTGKEISSTSGKLNLVFWARAGGDQAATDAQDGSVWFKRNSSIETNGGNITIGGGTDPLTGYARGLSNGGSEEGYAITRGVAINGSLDAGGGNISIRGRGRNPGNAARGVSISSDIKTSGTGTIDIHGVARAGSDAVALGDSFFSGDGDGSISAGMGSVSIRGQRDTGKAININSGSNITSQGLLVLDGSNGGEIASGSENFISVDRLLVLNSDKATLDSPKNGIRLLSASNVGDLSVSDKDSITIATQAWDGETYSGIQGTGKFQLFYGQDAAASGNTADYHLDSLVGLEEGFNFSTRLGNDGIIVDYLVVHSQSDLQTKMSENPDGNYALGAILTFDEDWIPVGDSESAFTGHFEGLNHNLKNITISQSDSDYVGFFGYTNGARIRNIDLFNVEVTGGSNVGGLIGYAEDTRIDGVTAGVTLTGSGDNVGGLVGSATGTSIFHSRTRPTSRVNGGTNVGGLVGSSSGTDIEGSSASGTVIGTGDNVGGLVGSATDSTSIVESYTSSVVEGGINVGGLVGISSDTSMRGASAAGDVTGTGDNVGGLIGNAINSNIDGSARSNVTGNNHIGGLVGYASSNTSISTGWVSNSSVNGNDQVGGLIGKADLTEILGGDISHTTISGKKQIGGLVGHASGTRIDGSVASVDVSGEVEVGGLVGMAGSSENSSTASTIFMSHATGQVSGASSVGGLVGSANGNTNINKSYASADVSSSAVNNDDEERKGTGGLVGYASLTTIESSYANGDVTGGSQVGGLVGLLENQSRISNSYASGDVVGKTYVGGLVGQLFSNTNAEKSHIENSYAATKNLEGDSFVGGLIGDNSDSTQENVIHSYWDTELSDRTDSAGGEGKTTAEMQDINTFNGTTPGWSIQEDTTIEPGNPFLAWADSERGFTMATWIIGTKGSSTGGDNTGGSNTGGGDTGGGNTGGGDTGGGNTGGGDTGDGDTGGGDTDGGNTDGGAIGGDDTGGGNTHAADEALRAIAALQQSGSVLNGTSSRAADFGEGAMKFSMNFGASPSVQSQPGQKASGGLELVDADEATISEQDSKRDQSGLLSVFVVDGGINVD